MNTKSKSDLCQLHIQKTTFFVSLTFVAVLFFSCLALTFTNTSSFALGTPDVVVNDEIELQDTINNSVKPIFVAFNIAILC
jgi:dipeptide/tripeptide permease